MHTDDLAAERKARVERYWKAAAEMDSATIGELVAEDVWRSGTLCSDVDVVRGRDAYTAYVERVQSHLTGYRNATHDILASPDGRRAYLHCTEWDAVNGNEIEVPLVIIFEFDDDALISGIDIFWKSTPDTAVYDGFVTFLKGFDVATQ